MSRQSLFTPALGQRKGLISHTVDLVRALLFDRRYFWHTAFLLFLGEVALSLLVIWKIPYTKIDWPAYMQQVDMFLAGERDYSKIEGETGPLVYPALHLYIYTAFHRLLPSIENVRPAQFVFLGFYLATYLAISTIYYLAGRPSNGGHHFPQVLLIPLTLSKRAHSIFLLRLFNDPIAMLIFYLSVIAFQIGGRKGWRLGCVLFSLALGVKMNILNFLPGLLVLLFQYRGIVGTVEGLSIIGLIQFLLPAPFFFSKSNPYLIRAYFTSAFDFSRQFLYEWTVNWRFISEETFLSRERAVTLLAGHLTVLGLFAAFKWSPVPGGTLRVLRKGFSDPLNQALEVSQVPAYHIPLVLFSANLIGMLFARSLHYQFHSWYFHQLPFLLYSGAGWGNMLTSVLIWVTVQYAWETAPSTISTSAALLAGHGAMVFGLFFHGMKRPSSSQKSKAK
ncbi:alpha-1,3-mannosyltransferase, putative [Cryptococcus deneoformans JEC21]|uniref:Dol-P-Man:Man(5)GlcNAc(2)-PP-Dol alpha-1,3-mannosyltransferase n=1 Tax=Cryptococcus deneoformans (strain JEC21 / ATCC MYA-565) TaxID=214684 RepID=ALG3_CRYD1|nr:alpha-1,3-mannosyltransferase, putative [Cryptococcus neoformans var. neoformans JEC21]P0CN92.1 RecName: Full=Dol-P-Man:Man(5)GlcNAc(2)-PP-Dol alpha-1,3-mannosyltransferase; AltName: Full=Asparagine-linked glycosylation protein 6; AltName: Full=Dol-P-Man-dependent alpha(1-3)-mannosyltransferase; AltName: Full=Dolichyl-P-Man:Man(5)GlcNAc(2)-PP-dolichyl mannosyltransferase [Cryptococcus neoformans var. neoformans JEC21]AAW46504.1 alpha-1,3-mannosyltransferase, putative [Cryptococcus neoformans v